MRAVCDPRTAMRVVSRLEVEGWLWVKRRAMGGKASVYFVNTGRLGVVLNPNSRKNQWHLEFERKYPGVEVMYQRGDMVSPMPSVKPMEPTPEKESSDRMSLGHFTLQSEESGDISAGSQVTFEADSSDILAFPIRKNRVNRLNRKDTCANRPTVKTDPRHLPFRLACETYARFKSVAFVWDASEARALSLLLKASPRLSLLDFQMCLTNRARSPGTAHGERPRLWLPNITRYQQGPLNRFHQREEINGNNLGNRKATAANEALARAQARVVEEDRDHETAAGDVPGPRRADGRDTFTALFQGA
jgi:hypothetical protein